MVIGWWLSFETYKEYKAVQYGWRISPGMNGNAQSMGYGQVPDEEKGSGGFTAFKGEGVVIG